MVKNIQDPVREREQFQVLYQSVDRIFERDKHIYDLRAQWLKYVIFLMTPRSDGLYKGYGELNFLFPFSGVPRGSDIILYGAGTYGQRLYRYLKKTEFCRVVLWVDREYAQLQKMGLDVEAPAELETSECSVVVIANTYDRSRRALYEQLIRRFPTKEIHMIDEQLLFSRETRMAFGLDDGKCG